MRTRENVACSIHTVGALRVTSLLPRLLILSLGRPVSWVGEQTRTDDFPPNHRRKITESENCLIPCVSHLTHYHINERESERR